MFFMREAPSNGDTLESNEWACLKFKYEREGGIPLTDRGWHFTGSPRQSHGFRMEREKLDRSDCTVSLLHLIHSGEEEEKR